MTVTCVECGSKFSSASNVNRHIRRVHKTQPKTLSHTSNHFKCLEGNCESSFKKNDDLISHLEAKHNKRFEHEEMKMKSMIDFIRWKSSIEDNKWRYVLKSKNKFGDGLKYYYYCNRSGRGKKMKNGSNQCNKRTIKSQGSCKLGFHCTSNIKLVIDKNKFTCIWQKVHYGHIPELQHIRLSKEERYIIAAKLTSGMLPSQILESVQCNAGQEMSRLNMLTMKDIVNIKTSFNIAIQDGRERNKKKNKILSKDMENAEHGGLKNLVDVTCCNLKQLNYSLLNDELVSDLFKYLNIINKLLHVQSQANILNMGSNRSKPCDQSMAERKENRNSNEPLIVEQSKHFRENSTFLVSQMASYDHQY